MGPVMKAPCHHHLIEENRCESTNCIWHETRSHQDGAAGPCAGKGSSF
ncbi:TPA: hypothetical protein MG550_18100 [Klebsiella aerogenes]|nr:hypothetical protein [Klebsiella aerogenes]